MTHTPGRLYQGIERDGFGMRMLASMGWEEGTGIGKNGTGIVKHLHAKKRQLNSGIGADARSDASGKIDWTLHAVSFESILKGLNQSYDTTDEIANNSGEGGEPVENTGHGAVKEDDSEKDNNKRTWTGRSAVGHTRRYRKRESQKRVTSYSEADLDAILGGISTFTATPAAQMDGKLGERVIHSGKGSEEVRQRTTKNKKREKHERNDTDISDLVEVDVVTKQHWALPPPPKEWWGWTVGFVPSGHIGDAHTGDVAGAHHKRGFDEADQERLAIAAHEGANRGKRGLGVGAGFMNTVRNKAGAKWEGKKTIFAENVTAEEWREHKTDSEEGEKKKKGKKDKKKGKKDKKKKTKR